MLGISGLIPLLEKSGNHLSSISYEFQVAITELQSAIDTAAPLANGRRAPVASTIDQAKELIAYAHRLSFTTSAPPGFIPGQTPLLHFKPPAPQDIQLRSSALHQFQRKKTIKLLLLPIIFKYSITFLIKVYFNIMLFFCRGIRT